MHAPTARLSLSARLALWLVVRRKLRLWQHASAEQQWVKAVTRIHCNKATHPDCLRRLEGGGDKRFGTTRQKQHGVIHILGRFVRTQKNCQIDANRMHTTWHAWSSSLVHDDGDPYIVCRRGGVFLVPPLLRDAVALLRKWKAGVKNNKLKRIVSWSNV